MIGKMSLTSAILLACACQISMAGIIAPAPFAAAPLAAAPLAAAPLAAAPFPAAPLAAAPLASAPLVTGYAHAVPHNIPPHASRIDISTRALAAPYIVAPGALSAPIISAPTAPLVAAPGVFGAPFAGYRSAAIFG